MKTWFTKKIKMSLIGLEIIGMCLIGSICTCASDTGIDSEAYETGESVEEQEVTTGTIDIDSEQGTLIFDGYEISEDESGNSILVTFFDFSNNSRKIVSALGVFDIRAVQKNLQNTKSLEYAFEYGPDYYKAYDNGVYELKYGEGIQFAVPFCLKDLEHPVVLSVYDVTTGKIISGQRITIDIEKAAKEIFGNDDSEGSSSRLSSKDTVNVIGYVFHSKDEDNMEYYAWALDDEDESVSFNGYSDEVAALGNLYISGGSDNTSDDATCPILQVDDSNLNLAYILDDLDSLELGKGWKISKDKGLGISVFTRRPNENYVEVFSKGYSFSGKGSIDNPFYITKDIQLINDCTYAVFVDWTIENKTKEKDFFGNRKIKYRNIEEWYEFQAFSSNPPTTESSDDKPRFVLNETSKLVSHDGYTKAKKIPHGNPLYKDGIGSFIINGYTEKAKEEGGVPVFLKKPGDKVTLWFRFIDDLDKRIDGEKVSIAATEEDRDDEFGTETIDYGKGGLVIQYTDSENNTDTIPEYVNFLEANACLSADTRVRLFEEGEYVVHLNYAIDEKGTLIGPFGESTNTDYYQLSCRFKIKNSSSMGYIFDAETSGELSDRAYTETGFKIDVAGSKSLNIKYTKTSLREGENGVRITDPRIDDYAKDQEVFTQPGIYTITFENSTTGGETTKTIFVGPDPFLKAMSVSGLTIDEINEKIRNGITIDEDGSFSS